MTETMEPRVPETGQRFAVATLGGFAVLNLAGSRVRESTGPAYLNRPAPLACLRGPERECRGMGLPGH